jgi:hypothetical protein
MNITKEKINKLMPFWLYAIGSCLFLFSCNTLGSLCFLGGTLIVIYRELNHE